RVDQRGHGLRLPRIGCRLVLLRLNALQVARKLSVTAAQGNKLRQGMQVRGWSLGRSDQVGHDLSVAFDLEALASVESSIEQIRELTCRLGRCDPRHKIRLSYFTAQATPAQALPVP